jgi:hypothetical protein
VDALADEAYQTAVVEQGTADGATLAREVDDAGYTRTLRPIQANRLTEPAGDAQHELGPVSKSG